MSNKNIKPLILLSDEPIGDINQDWLGFSDWARVIADAAIGTEGPFTVGLFGAWGVGKTSILRLAKRLVDQSDKTKSALITTVEFNPWRYEQEEAPLIPLIATIIAELDKKRSLGGKLNDGVKILGESLRSVLMGLSGGLKGKFPFLGELNMSVDGKKILDEYRTLRTKWMESQIETCLFHNAFKSLEEAMDRNPHKVVVFIDDLDRCLPHNSIRLIESLKLVFNQPSFLFVIALNHQILENFLDKRYKEDFGLKEYHHGQSYLDKIVQLSLFIPPLERRFIQFIDNTLNQEALKKFKKDLTLLRDVIGLATEYNPRQLIRFLNMILIDERIYEMANPQEVFPLSSFIVARGLRQHSEFVYKILLSNPKLCDELKECNNFQSVFNSIEKWLKKEKSEDDTKELISFIQNRKTMLQLLISDPGKQWLNDYKLRNKIDTFIIEEGEISHRYSQKELQWIQKEIERAVAQLKSGDEELVQTGLQSLLVLGEYSENNFMPEIEKAHMEWRNNPRISESISMVIHRYL